MANNEDGIILSLYKKTKRIIIIVLGLLIIGIISYIFILYGGKLIVDEEKLVLEATTTIETSDGRIIHRLYHENRTPISIEDIPIHVQDAFIAIEDNRFYSHHGVDFKAIIRAIYRDIIAFDKVEGASTITQQLAKNLFLENEKTWMRKTKEVMAALYLERSFSKEEILELYLNKIYFGQGVYGIELASQKFFSKPAKELLIGEGALLAGLIKAPNSYSPMEHEEKALARRDLVLAAMNATEAISVETMLQEQGKGLGLSIQEGESMPWKDSYIDLVLKEAATKHNLPINELKRGGYRIVINLNETAQKIAYNQFKNVKYFPGNTDGVQGAFIMIEQQTGGIIAAIGGRDYELGDLNRITVKRQPGSTMKPLAVYGPAMMKEGYEPYTKIKDEQMEYDGDVFSNADQQYDGDVSIYDAIIKSKNAPAVWLLNEIGIDYAKQYLEKMNMNIQDEGLAIALGGLSEGLTPLNMVEGYRAFANAGEIIDLFTIDKIYNGQNELIVEASINKKQIFSPQVAWNMTEMLMSTVERGTGTSGHYSKALAGKTGSTEHPHVKGKYKDAWFVGYTPEYVSALWMGYDKSDAEHYLTEGSAAPTILTKQILTEIDQHQSLTANFTMPENVHAIQKPIVLPTIENVNISYTFGGLSLLKGKITWTGSEDDRIIYRIYKEQEGTDKRIGEISGETEFIIDKVSIFQPSYYYVVPYDSLTNREGERSETVKLSIN